MDRDFTRALLAEMIREGVGARVKWWAESHVRFVDEALFAQMKEAGCVECGLGIESGDVESYLWLMRAYQPGGVFGSDPARVQALADELEPVLLRRAD